LNLLYRKH